MQYSLNLAEDGRILSVTEEQYDPEGYIVESFPEGNVYDYRLVDDEYVYDPLPAPDEVASAEERIEAQVMYTALMTDTLLETEE